MFSSIFNIFSIHLAIVQSNSIICFQECFKIFAFCKYIRVHIYKIHKFTWRWFHCWKIINFDATYLCVPYGDFGATCAPRRNVHLVNFLSKTAYLKWILAICKTCQSITLLRDINFQLTPNSFLRYCYTIAFVNIISCSLLKDV